MPLGPYLAGDGIPYVKAMWHYARGIAYTAQGDFTAAKAEANAIAALEGGDFTLLKSSGVPAQDVLALARTVIEARVAQRQGDKVAAMPGLLAWRMLFSMPEFHDAPTCQRNLTPPARAQCPPTPPFPHKETGLRRSRRREAYQFQRGTARMVIPHPSAHHAERE